MPVKNIREAVYAALEQSSKPLDCWEIRNDACALRTSAFVYYPTQAIRRELLRYIREGVVQEAEKRRNIKVYFLTSSVSPTIRQDFEDWGLRTEACQSKLKGHGFGRTQKRSLSFADWVVLSKKEKEQNDYLRVHLDDLEQIIQELRRKD